LENSARERFTHPVKIGFLTFIAFFTPAISYAEKQN
jgi:hypothetical protein